MAAVTASTAQATTTHPYEDFVTRVALFQTNPATPKSPDQPDSDHSTISFDGKFQRIYQSRNTQPGYRSSGTPRQMVDQSEEAIFRIRADKDSIFNIISQMNIIPLRLENNIYWRTVKNQQPGWDPVEGREGLVNRIVESLLRLVARMENGKIKVEVKVQLKIEERIRVAEEEYEGMWRAKREGDLEKLLIEYQEMIDKKVTVEDLKRVLVLATTTIPLDSETIDAIARRAYKTAQILKIKKGLMVVTILNKEDGTECSICLGPKCSTPAGAEEEEPGVLRFSKCRHSFHKHCLLLWFKKRLTCPLCRTSLS